jgi:hypothetical protein
MPRDKGCPGDCFINLPHRVPPDRFSVYGSTTIHGERRIPVLTILRACSRAENAKHVRRSILRIGLLVIASPRHKEKREDRGGG